jgi:hypothetical protein
LHRRHDHQWRTSVSNLTAHKLTGKQVLVRFDSTDRNFVLYAQDVRTQEPISEIGRKPAVVWTRPT